MSISNLLSPNNYNLYANNVNSKNVDLITINHQPYPPVPPGGFLPTPLVSNKLLRVNGAGTATTWADISLTNIPSGLPGDVLKTVAPNTIAWDPVKPQDITPGAPLSILHTKSDGSAAEFVEDLVIPGTCDVNSTLHVAGSGTFDSNCLFSQDVVVQNNAIVDQNLTITNQDLNVLAGNSNLQDVDVQTGVIKLSGISGLNNQLMISDGAGILSYQSLTPNIIEAGADFNVITSFSGLAQWYPLVQVKRIFFGTTFLAQNINSAATGVATFDLSPFANISNSTTSAVVGISQPSNTQFTIGTLALYKIDINGYIDPSSSMGIGNSIVLLSLEVGGIEQSRSCIVCNGNYSFGGSLVSSISAGQTIRILFRRLVGTSSLNTFSVGSPLPNFSSTITISNIN